ncbi:sulfotransferase, partial [Candidatus Peregrinibacteria bacterium]|nr:sulfotransferase [Candidatus Peregrinibacteria bacterium]
GTTSLHQYLSQHPDIFMLPQKETNFFAQDSALCLIDRTVRSEQEYKELFNDAGGATAVGETSPAYLAVPDSPKLIKKLIPDVKLIVILRNPIERAYSHYLMRRRQGKEFRTTFEECLAVDDLDPARSYKSRGFYGQQLERYLKEFSMEQMKIFLYEDFLKDALRVVHEICTFLGVDPAFTPDMKEKYNVNPPADKPMSSAAKKILQDLYRNDIALAGHLIGRDVSHWLQ